MKTPLTDEPCPRCLELAQEGRLRAEPVQQLPEGAHAPLGLDGRKCCHDCASADTLVKMKILETFEMARVATANCRQEQWRLPGAPMGLVQTGHMRPSQSGDLEAHWEWLDKNDWFGLRLEEE